LARVERDGSLVFVTAAIWLRNHPSGEGLRALGESKNSRSTNPMGTGVSSSNRAAMYGSGLVWKLTGI